MEREGVDPVVQSSGGGAWRAPSRGRRADPTAISPANLSRVPGGIGTSFRRAAKTPAQSDNRRADHASRSERNARSARSMPSKGVRNAVSSSARNAPSVAPIASPRAFAIRAPWLATPASAAGAAAREPVSG